MEWAILLLLSSRRASPHRTFPVPQRVGNWVGLEVLTGDVLGRRVCRRWWRTCSRWGQCFRSDAATTAESVRPASARLPDWWRCSDKNQHQFLPARRYASAALAMAMCLSVCVLQAGVLSKRLNKSIMILSQRLPSVIREFGYLQK